MSVRQKMNLNQKSRWLLVASISVIWIVTPILLATIVKWNSKRGVYGNSDAILIPIMNSVLLFVIGLPYFIFFTIAAYKRYSAPRSIYCFNSSVRQWIILILFILGVLIISTQVLYWADWSHWPIALGYAFAILWLFWVRPIASASLPKRVQVTPFDLHAPKSARIPDDH